jgi:hypothetical protein
MLGIACSLILVYAGVYLPLAVFTDRITTVPNTWFEIVIMVVGVNVVLMIIGHYALKDRAAKVARETQLYGSTTGEEPWRTEAGGTHRLGDEDRELEPERAPRG